MDLGSLIRPISRTTISMWSSAMARSAMSSCETLPITPNKVGYQNYPSLPASNSLTMQLSFCGGLKISLANFGTCRDRPTPKFGASIPDVVFIIIQTILVFLLSLTNIGCKSLKPEVESDFLDSRPVPIHVISTISGNIVDAKDLTITLGPNVIVDLGPDDDRNNHQWYD